MSEWSLAGELLATFQKWGVEPDSEFLREALRMMVQALMELDVSTVIDASPYERRDNRLAYRNGYRRRIWQTRLGGIHLQIPKLRKGTYYPSFMAAHHEVEQILLEVIQRAFVEGARVPVLQNLLDSLSFSPPHSSQLALLAEQLDDIVCDFRERPLSSIYPYLWLTVLQLPPPSGRRSVPVAIGLRETGQAELLAFNVSASLDDRHFWVDFLTTLKQRGLQDVDLVLSDAYVGLKTALRELLGTSEWYYTPAKTPDEVLAQLVHDRETTIIAAVADQFVQSDTTFTGLPWQTPASQTLAWSAPSVVVSSSTMLRLKQALTQSEDAVASERLDTLQVIPAEQTTPMLAQLLAEPLVA